MLLKAVQGNQIYKRKFLLKIHSNNGDLSLSNVCVLVFDGKSSWDIIVETDYF